MNAKAASCRESLWHCKKETSLIGDQSKRRWTRRTQKLRPDTWVNGELNHKSSSWQTRWIENPIQPFCCEPFFLRLIHPLALCRKIPKHFSKISLNFYMVVHICGVRRSWAHTTQFIAISWRWEFYYANNMFMLLKEWSEKIFSFWRYREKWESAFGKRSREKQIINFHKTWQNLLLVV